MAIVVVEERVREMISEKLKGKVLPKDIKSEDRIEEDLGADSLDVVELWMKLEEEFDFGSPENWLELRTVGQIVDFIKSFGKPEKA